MVIFSIILKVHYLRPPNHHSTKRGFNMLLNNLMKFLFFEIDVKNKKSPKNALVHFLADIDIHGEIDFKILINFSFSILVDIDDVFHAIKTSIEKHPTSDIAIAVFVFGITENNFNEYVDTFNLSTPFNPCNFFNH